MSLPIRPTRKTLVGTEVWWMDIEYTLKGEVVGVAYVPVGNGIDDLPAIRAIAIKFSDGRTNIYEIRGIYHRGAWMEPMPSMNGHKWLKRV